MQVGGTSIDYKGNGFWICYIQPCTVVMTKRKYCVQRHRYYDDKGTFIEGVWKNGGLLMVYLRIKLSSPLK